MQTYLLEMWDPNQAINCW